MAHKIGDRVKILCFTRSDQTLHLIEASDRDRCSANDVTEYVVQIIGMHQVKTQALICLCDFDPHSYFSFKINDFHIKTYDVDAKFLDNKVAYIDDTMIWVKPPTMVVPQVNLNDPGGEWCVICPKFIQYAAPNLPNDGFVCRSCRQTRMYMVNPYLQKNNIDRADVDWIKD